MTVVIFYNPGVNKGILRLILEGLDLNSPACNAGEANRKKATTAKLLNMERGMLSTQIEIELKNSFRTTADVRLCYGSTCFFDAAQLRGIGKVHQLNVVDEKRETIPFIKPENVNIRSFFVKIICS